MTVDEGGAQEVLSEYHWPPGLKGILSINPFTFAHVLVDAFIKNLNKVPLRFFVCDDSGSMASTDGRKLVVNGQFMQ